jgi:putative acetyltransferase
MSNIIIRNILPADNATLAAIIRNSLKEFKANKPGTVYFDNTTDTLYEVFKTSGSTYFVAEENGLLLGGCGIFPTANLPTGTCELVKLYLSPAARGKGLGKLLMGKSMQAAKEMGYTIIYLETMPELTIAVPLYEKLGFTYLPGPLGNSGHNGCSIWMVKRL